tara:strand:- start:67 stop:672 length:606 start_codon:yes stop_codon:yes gene_type:complete
MVNDRNIRLGFLASHNGSTMQAIVDACVSNFIKADPVVLISNNSSSGAIARAIQMKIPFHHLSSETHPDFEDLDKIITKTLKEYSVDLVLLTGYMKKIGFHMLKNFNKKILNSHPSLLPKHGGTGMYGREIHKKVLESGEKTTGSSIHYVESNYDSGQIIEQIEIPISCTDSIDSLEERVKILEKKLYINSINKIINNWKL